MSESTTVLEPEPRGRPEVPGYELIQPLGRGGFGEVWLGRAATGAHYAVKLLPEGRNSEIEFESLSTLERSARGHEHLVHIRQVDRVPGYIYYVMELADDFRGLDAPPDFDPGNYEPHTLALELRRRGRLELGRALEIIRQLLGALAYLHDNGLLHRDVKPGNVVFVGGKAKLADIGLVAKRGEVANRALSRDYAPTGGVVDASGDLYCLGRMLYQMLTGVPAREFPWLPDDADPELLRIYGTVRAVIDRACARDGDQRFQKAGEFSAALDACAGTGAGAAAPPPVTLVERLGGHWRAAALAVVGLAVIVTLIVIGSSKPEPVATPDRAGAGDPDAASAAPAVVAAADTLELLYKSDVDAGEHFVLSPMTIPLRTGELLKVRLSLGAPGYPLVAVLSESDGVQIAYPTDGVTQSPVRDLEVPSGNDWWPLSPPEGTITFVALVGDTPIEDAEAIRLRLAELGNMPRVAPNTMLVLASEGEPLKLEGLAGRDRGIDDVRRTVESEPGLLVSLREAFAERFARVTAKAVPQVEIGE